MVLNRIGSGVFTELIRAFNVHGTQVEEVWSLDEQALEDLKPIYGLIFLFKWQGGNDSSRLHPDADLSIDENVYFAKQVIHNACATQAILSILLNCPMINLGADLESFKDFTKDFDPDNKGLAMSNSELIRGVHNSFARSDPFMMDSSGSSSSEKEDIFHFISYVPIQGALYELDGLSAGPVNLGPCTEDNWLEKVRPVIEERMARYTSSEIRFNLLALIKNRDEVYRTRIDEIEGRLRHANDTNSLEFMQLERDDLLRKIEFEKIKFKKYEAIPSLYRHEIGLLPYQSTQPNDEFYPFLFIESNLGIPLEYVDKIYKYAHDIFMNARGDIAETKDTVNLLKESTRCMLLINADCYSALNTRYISRDLLLLFHSFTCNHLDPINELKFIDLLFTFPKHTKHSTIWFHRKWLVLMIHQQFSFDDHISSWQHEIFISRRVAELYPKNYYAWTYRHWILQNISNNSLQSKSFFDEELKIMKSWVQKNISDYSGFQHLQRCLIRLSKYYDNSFGDLHGISRKDILERVNLQLQNQGLKNNNNLVVILWYREIQFTKDLILRYPGHESLWYHLRFLSFGWIWLKLSGYLNNSIKIKCVDDKETIDQQNYNPIVKEWPDLEKELEFSRHCIRQVDLIINQDDNERLELMVIQKQNALAFELWISELNGRTRNDIDVKELIVKLANISINSNYYIVQNK
ncbi:10825_t:CDS:10 [Funneliformis geosporum]|uniref:Ubiquitin carboxyl-terminal hydrolase n=1 Tax=Funneliformis geosporum TaxID=1117311 RepID=A0A9W4WSB8_9GLOM|nr:10825_t:CDS:10 [Funneliformis geosporum]CAI2175122.1 499_t:CDS:10 [Funneliformis geosporum]